MMMMEAITRIFAVATLALAAVTTSAAGTGSAATQALPAAAVPTDCAPRAPTPAGLDFSCPRADGTGCQPLEFRNFAGRDLRNANFQGATLVGVTFIHARLQGANFKNATFMSGGTPLAAPTDFTAANLDNACFIGAAFKGNVYFTAANLSAADFSGQDFTASRVNFGDQRLRIDDPQRRPLFRGARMNCEFIALWAALDLDSADISACKDKLAGREFANARMSNVDFSQAVLDGARFASSDLRGAVFTGSSLQCATAADGTTSRCVDFSNAQLQGAVFEGANLSGATLYKAVLSTDPNYRRGASASFANAHLKNVNLNGAQLIGVSFRSANFYGRYPANGGGGCQTADPAGSGFNQHCASARNAQISDVDFSNAYLYGVDFSTATIRGGTFTQAVLSGANFGSADLDVLADTGKQTSFALAHLQGTNLASAKRLSADLTDAFVDFRSGGNNAYLLLPGAQHNRFACSPGAPCSPASGLDVCVSIGFPVTSVPAANTQIICPDGAVAGASGCGAADAAGRNRRWRSTRDIADPAHGTPRAWYAQQPTWGQPTGDSAVICDDLTRNPKVTNW